MKKEIAKNNRYELYVDQEKNRYYLNLFGYWQHASEIPDYLDDLKKIAASLSPGFTGLVDIRKLKTPTPEIVKLHVKSIDLLIKTGVKRVAMVFDQNIVKIAAEMVMREAEVEKQARQFNDIKEAEDWLDGKDV